MTGGGLWVAGCEERERRRRKHRIGSVNRALESIVFAVVILAAKPAAAALSEHNLSETIECFENLRAGPRSAAVKDLRLTSGHLDLVLKTGCVTPVRAGEDTVGLF